MKLFSLSVLVLWTLFSAAPCLSGTLSGGSERVAGSPGSLAGAKTLPSPNTGSVRDNRPPGKKAGWSEVEPSVRFTGPASVQKVVTDALVKHRLAEEPGLESFAQASCAEPIFVASLERGWADYYLVPVTVPGKDGVSASAVVEKKGDFLSFGAISFYDDPLPHFPPLSAAFKSLLSQGAAPRWVFKLAQECMAPINPLIRYERDGKTYFYTSRNESVTELTPLVPQLRPEERIR